MIPVRMVRTPNRESSIGLKSQILSTRRAQWVIGETAMQADYVIVGAGSAGCVLANRLTEDASTRVVLIEAGGRDWNPLIHIPAGYMKLLDHPTLTWGFKAEADPGTNGRAINYPRGRVLGGSSSINGMIYVRGQPEDFDHWGQLGNRGWTWDDVLPFFRKAENWEGKEDAVHGKGGPLFTSHGRDKPLLCRAAVEAGRQLGLEYREDVNDLPSGAGDGIGWVQQTRGPLYPQHSTTTTGSSLTVWRETAARVGLGRRRASTARSYLQPALKRPNLQVVTGALVHRVLFDGTRAVGVEYSRNGATERVDVAGEVILAAGAIGSPHILQLSGVGDPDHLERAGIAVHHELRGVGRNMQDHYQAHISCEIQGAPSLNQQSRGLGLAGQVLRYLATGNGILTYAASLVAASVKVLPESATPDVQALFAHGSYAAGALARAGHDAGHDLRDVADASAEPWLCRGALAAARGPAEHQPALLQRRDRLPRRGGRAALDPPAVRGAGTGEIRRGGDSARARREERRRTAALREADRRHRVPRDLHLQDGSRHDGGGG